MVKTLLGIFWMLGCLSLSGQALSDNGSGRIAQDGAGTVWGMPLQSWSEGVLTRYAGKQWVSVTVPGMAGFHLAALVQGDDRGVYALWQQSDTGQTPTLLCCVTSHRGIDSRILTRFTVPRDANWTQGATPALWAGHGGDFWIEGNSPQLWHVSALAEAQPSVPTAAQPFAVTPEQHFGSDQPGAQSWPFNTQRFSSLTDSLGRRWFWQSGLNSWGPGILRGVLIWDGKTLAYHPTLPGLPDRPLSTLVALDDHHFWAAQSKNGYPWQPQPSGGLYRIDTQTLAAVPETPPAKAAFQTIVRILRINGDLCVLEEQSFNGRTATLWRRHGSVWRRESAALTASQANDYGNKPPLVSLETPLGTWLAVNGTGLDWLPRNGSPAVRVDWRRGVGVGEVYALFRLPQGTVLVLSDSGMTTLSLLPPLLPKRPDIDSDGLGAAHTLLIADPRRHLWSWGNSDGGQPALREWDGQRWQVHLLPKDIPGANAWIPDLLACDSTGRVWLKTIHNNLPTQPQAQPINGLAVYDPVRDAWSNYSTISEALKPAARLPGLSFLSRYGADTLPVFSGDGRVAYLDNNTLHYYDGHIWHHWEGKEIKHSPYFENFQYNPRFNAQGYLEADVSQETWEWQPETGWQKQGPMTPQAAPSSAAEDTEGLGWSVKDGAVYRNRAGLSAKVAALSGPGSPFWDRRNLLQVLRDPTGRYFFLTTPGGMYQYVAWSSPVTALPSAPRVQIVPMSADSVRLRFAAASHGTRWFQWRLNGGAWSAPQTAGTVLLTLPYGSYYVEAQAVDTLLQASRPSAAVFVLRPASTAQIARWVRALLSGPDDAREAAVAGLVKQPTEALPALTAARPGASEQARWWLDAAIQQITDKNAPSE